MADTGDAVSFLKTRVPASPRVAIVLGSGLKGLADTVQDAVSIPYSDIPGFPQPSVKGHSGSLTFGTLGGTPIVCQLGRFHLYEGWDISTVIHPVRVFSALGATTLVVTNAAGGIRRTFEPPQLMLISDHINMMFRSPLAGPVVESELRFPDMSNPYDKGLGARAREVAVRHHIALEPGVYAGVLGPSYETPSEIRMLAGLGADAVGMSTVPEVIAARARGTMVLGISIITNRAAGISTQRLSHAEVLDAGQRASAMLTAVVAGVVGGL